MKLRHCRLLGRHPCSGFALRDMCSVVAVVGLLLALATVSMPRFRSGALLEECIDNQREMSAGSAAFALANDDKFAGFLWQPGDQSSLYGDLRAQAASPGAGVHAAQAVDFWRRRGQTFFPPISGWFSDNLYWNTPLLEFLNKELTDPFTVCPGDAHQLAWRTDPIGFSTGAYLPLQPEPSTINRRWTHASSYLATAGAIDPYQSDPSPGTFNRRFHQAGFTQGTFSLPSQNSFGPSRQASVAHPSAKVFFFDFADWHFAATPTYFAFEGATLPAAFFDGAVRVVRSDRARTPWYPPDPTYQGAVPYSYAPSLWQPLGGLPPGTPAPPLANVPVTDPFRYTRDGLLGIDFPPLSRVRGARVGR